MSVPFLAASVELQADLVQLRKDFDAAEKLVQRAVRDMERGFSRVDDAIDKTSKSAALLRTGIQGIIAAVGIGSVTALARDILTFADTVDAASNRLGIAVEEIQRMKFAAEQAGTEFGALETGLKEFLRRLSEVARTGKGELLPVLEALDIKIRDASTGLRRDGLDVFNEFMAKLGQVADNADRLAVSQAAAGRAGTELVKVAKDYEKIKASAPIVSEEDIQKLDRAGDMMARLKQETMLFFAEAALGWASMFEDDAPAIRLREINDRLVPVYAEMKRLQALMEEDPRQTDPRSGERVDKRLALVRQRYAELAVERRKLMDQFKREEEAESKPSKKINLPGAVDEDAIKRQKDLLKQIEQAYAQSSNNKIRLAEIERDENLRLIEETIKDEETRAEAKLKVNEIYANRVAEIHRDIAELEAAETEKLMQQSERMIDEMERKSEQHARRIDRVAEEISGVLTDAAFDGKEAFRDFAEYFARDFVQEMIKQLLALAAAKAMLTGDASGGGKGSDSIGSIAARAAIGGIAKGVGYIFRGWFASGTRGNNLRPGEMGIAGERGMELVRSTSTGTSITPLGPSSLKSNVNVQVFNSTGQPVRIESDMMAGEQIIRAFVGAAVSAVQQDIANGGPTAKTMQQTFQGLRPRIGT